jgi:transcriptional regulator with XRE-family HTH domain
MMASDLTSLSTFRFGSLRKFMQPLYAELNRHIEAPEDEKRKLIRAIIPRFFQRLRTYREVSLEQIAERANLSIEDVQRFEAGQTKASSDIEYAYCRLCSAFHERDFFERRLHDYLHPSIRDSRESIAMDALKRFGVILPDVDYASLHSPKGKLLSFPQKL